MIVWGGTTGSNGLDTGGLYDPVTDAWEPTEPTASVPSGRRLHTAVWTGSQMLVWGGYNGSNNTDTGGRYDPILNTWTPMTVGSGPPLARSGHTAVWATDQMLVWGGAVSMYTAGGSYCAASPCTVATWYRDADGDGYGNGTDSVLSCTTPTGYIGSAGDCDDARSDVHPGVADTSCNGVDENCSGVADEGYAPVSTSCGVGVCAASGSTACVGGAVQDTCVPGFPSAEVCDSFDNDCDGTIDNALPPSAPPSLQIMQTPSGNIHLVWSSIPSATAYDVVRGDLGLLASSHGDFAVATGGCLANDATTGSDDPALPSSGGGFWYLVRALNCGGAGSYDAGGPGQQGSRDAEIQASGAACP